MEPSVFAYTTKVDAIAFPERLTLDAFDQFAGLSHSTGLVFCVAPHSFGFSQFLGFYRDYK
jgi:hypothetical protein